MGKSCCFEEGPSMQGGFTKDKGMLVAKCGHQGDFQLWQNTVKSQFCQGRKKPLHMVGCFQCGVALSEEQIRHVCNDAMLQELESYLLTIPKTCTPTSLADFNYGFGADHTLRTLDEGHYTFHYVSETHYWQLGVFIVEEIQRRMEAIGLQKILLPANGKAQTAVYASPDLGSAARICLLIQGSGEVRA